MEAQLAAQCSCVVEYNAVPQLATPPFRALRERYPYTFVQIVCCCDGAVLRERYEHRAHNGERHPGHLDHQRSEELAPTLLGGTTTPLDIDGLVIKVDTTDWNAVNYSQLLATVSAAM